VVLMIQIDLVIGRNVACVYAPRQRKHHTICDKVLVPSGLKAVCDYQLPKCLHVSACQEGVESVHVGAMQARPDLKPATATNESPITHLSGQHPSAYVLVTVPT
jgi:hypothetical protein